MDSPFRSWYGKPAQRRRSYAYHPSLYGMPIYPVDSTRQARHSAYADEQPPAEKKSGPRVVQVPVQFYGSDYDRRSESALRIQKVIRGFLARKSVGKIREIKAQVDEIEARLLRDEVVEMIRANEKERLRMSESLMNLLLKLDGIRGIDSGIRICRKGVTRKAIALQEKIDALCATDSEGNADDKVEIGAGVPAAAELEGSRIEHSENSNDFEETLDDSREESKGLNVEKMEVERDSVLTGESDVVVTSPGEETNLETETGALKTINFEEDDVGSVEKMLVQYNGKDMINGEDGEDDAIGNCEFLQNSELGEILGDDREKENGKDVEVEKEIREVERNHLDAEVGGVPVTSVAEATLVNFDFDEGNAETEMETLAFSDDHGEKLCYLSEELMGRDSLEVEDMAMEVEREHLNSECDDVPVTVLEASPETQGAKGTPENLDFGVERAESMKEISVDKSGEDMAVMEKEDLDRRNRELLEQLIEDNKKMMLSMTQLNERNEMHLQMLDALSNRVESLEKAYLCDMIRNRRKRMKKKNKYDVTCVED